jgi:hypothetical protein
VETVNVEDDSLDPGVIVVGLSVQVRPEGAVQESVIGSLNPPTELALIVKFAEPAAGRLTL